MTAATQVIIDWISSLGWDDRQELGWPIVPGPYVPPSPDQLLIITGGGGFGYMTEEPSVDSANFQARLRGDPDDPLGAEIAAQLLDTMILRAHFPVAVGGTSILNVFRSGSGPDPLPFDPGDRRTEFTNTYTIITGV
jgi:hypothetical protein